MKIFSNNIFGLFQVLSRGRIVWQTRTRVLGLNATTSLHFPVTREMLPQARIVAFSIHGEGVGAEVVSDSVELKETCFGEVRSH